jgi:hypothetical protein
MVKTKLKASILPNRRNTFFYQSTAYLLNRTLSFQIESALLVVKAHTQHDQGKGA